MRVCCFSLEIREEEEVHGRLGIESVKDLFDGWNPDGAVGRVAAAGVGLHSLFGGAHYQRRARDRVVVGRAMKGVVEDVAALFPDVHAGEVVGLCGVSGFLDGGVFDWVACRALVMALEVVDFGLERVDRFNQ